MLTYVIISIVNADERLEKLRSSAVRRRSEAMRPGTRKNLVSCQTAFIQFCLTYGVSLDKPTVDDVGAFTELLVDSNLTVATIKNYCVAIKTLYAEWGNVEVLRSFYTPAWRFMLKGLAYSTEARQDERSAMTLGDLTKMVDYCDKDKELCALQVALTFGYFGYLRISNLAPETASSFDMTRHTTWAEVCEKDDGIIVGLKWSKTLQARKGITPIPLPVLKGRIVCPLRTWRIYVRLHPEMENRADVPLLLTTGSGGNKPVTIPMLRSMFHKVIRDVGLMGRKYTPHSLRRGGATYSFSQGVPMQYIKQHGTWQSDTVERYLIKTPLSKTPVVEAFNKLSL